MPKNILTLNDRISRPCDDRDHQCVFYFETDYEGTWCMLDYNDINGDYGMGRNVKQNCPYNYSREEIIQVMELHNE